MREIPDVSPEELARWHKLLNCEMQHRQTCPVCGRKLVNIYFDRYLGWRCADCIRLEEKIIK